MYTSPMAQKRVDVLRVHFRTNSADDNLRAYEQRARKDAPEGVKLHRLVVVLQHSDLVSCGWYYWES